jgi:hypothetical protein
MEAHVLTAGRESLESIIGTIPVLAIALVGALIALSAFIRTYHKRKSSKEKVLFQEPEAIPAR